MTVPGPGPRIRDDLADLEPYVSPQRPARFRMNTNESPYPPPPSLLDEVVGLLRETELNRYPPRDADGLARGLARHLDWSQSGVWVANGSNEVFQHLFLAYGGPDRTALCFEPTYSLHTLIPRISGSKVVHVGRDDAFQIDLDTALVAIRSQQPSAVLVCSPNNPTGNCESLDVVAALCDATDGIVVVDEAYGEFAGAGRSARPLLDETPNLVVVKTFSKAWSLAGVRLGYMLAAPEIVEGMLRVRLPYHLSAFTQLMGLTALKHEAEAGAKVAAIVEERNRISVELQAMGVVTFPSRANFVLFRVDDPKGVWDALLARGVLIRSYAGVPGLEGCLRVTAGLPEETEAFLSAMREVL